jgi:NADPH-dependent glutamate synthase beta subunit-like oxidoreductase
VGVFAGGDNVNGADLVVTAMADGQRAAIAIDNYLQSLG